MKGQSDMKPRFYFVEYNGRFLACYKSLKRAINYIAKKHLKDDEDNVLRIVDNNGEFYNTANGEHIEFK